MITLLPTPPTAYGAERKFRPRHLWMPLCTVSTTHGPAGDALEPGWGGQGSALTTPTPGLSPPLKPVSFHTAERPWSLYLCGCWILPEAPFLLKDSDDSGRTVLGH